MVPKHHNNTFILLLANSGQSFWHQIYFGRGLCCQNKVKFRRQKQKIYIFQNALEPPQKGQYFCF